jgi:mono/diheme cytochrome c family protein
MSVESSKPRWPTVLAGSAFALLLVIGSVVGFYAGEEKPAVVKAKSTLLAKLERDRPKPVPTAAARIEEPSPEPMPEEKPKAKPKPTKAAPPPPATKPAEPKPEPKKPEPEPKKPEPAAVQVSFDKVLPIFKAKCNVCHGDPTIKGDLDLRSLMAIGKSPNSKILVPGKPDESDLYDRIKDGSMPPPGKEKLTAAETQLIADWIKSGAK